ncbi:MAG: hypothetical protein GY835_11030 [bacterium]|nr:hypothetical protein [bacterium]
MVESAGKGDSLRGKTLYIPRMSEEGSRLFAAVFRSVGINARMTPTSTMETRERAARYLSGEECYPAQITLGNFLRVIGEPDFDPENTGFFMPSAEGPCRFGQYATLFRKIFNEMGMPWVNVISPSSRYGYRELGELDSGFERNAWRALVAADILRQKLMMIRPYEIEKGATDRVADLALTACEEVLAEESLGQSRRLKRLIAVLIEYRDKFRAIPLRTEERPLIGVVGEIFCRLDEYSNGNVIRRVEELGGEVWLSGISEWIAYTRFSRDDLARQMGRGKGLKLVKMKIASAVMDHEAHELYEPYKEDFAGREEPHDLAAFLEPGDPYLPFRGSLGEMTLSVARAIYLQQIGADGVLDISPFTCMNGIISEAVYPRISRDYGDIPIRNLYFDGTETDIDRDLGMFLDLSRAYRRRRLDLASRAGA